MRVQKKFTQPTLAQQHSKDEVDINNIMKRYRKTGIIDHVAKHQGNYGENDGIDYHQSMNIIRRADEMFLELPSQVRKEFGNNPAEFLDFVDNPANIEKLREMGLTNTPITPTSTTSESPPDPSVDQPTKTPSDPAPASPESAV